MEQLRPVRHRLAIRALASLFEGDRTRRIIVAGLLGTAALVVLQAGTQAIDFGVFDLWIRGINSDTHHSVFGIASLLAQTAVAAASVWRGCRAERQRGAWFVLGALVGGLVVIRGLTTFNATMLAVPLTCLFGLVCRLTWRDSGAARTVVWAGLVLLAASFLLHKVGLAADASAVSQHTWSYQITSMVKHGAELAGWMLLATGIAAAVERSAQEVTADESLLREMESVPRALRVRPRTVVASGAPLSRRRSVDTDEVFEKGNKAMLNGLMMDDFQLSLTVLVERAERLSSAAPVVSRRPDGSVRRTTLGECAQRARRVASGLAGIGIKDGDRVATMLWNQTEHLELYFAVPLMGAVIHTLNPRLSAEDLSYIAADAEDRIVVVDESLLHVLESIDYDFEQVIVVSDSGSSPNGTIEYESLLSESEPMTWPAIDERRAAAMCYTSGTTGRPKGVVYSHRALVLHSLVFALPDALGISSRDSILPAVPMFHVNGWNLPYTAALTGAKLVLPGPRLDPVSLLDLLEGERVTFTAGVPTVWMAVLQAIDAEPERWGLRSLATVNLGGAAVPASLIASFERHSLTIVQGWGMTETSPLGALSKLPADLESLPSCEQYEYRARQGTPIPLIEIRGRDDDGALIPWDDEAMGELEIRGPWVAAAYHRGTGADKFTDDGWFRTGDVVRINERGCMRICDRAKDLVKSGGEWISSVDLENQLMGHSAVAEAAVIAIPDEKWGERPLAAVVLRDGMQASPEELREHLGTDFAKWQLPDRIEFIEAIPRTATGKFKKTALRERFAAAAL